MTYVEVDTGDNSVAFSGANVFIQNGTGSTGGTGNSTGNLIVGYNGKDSTDYRTGSHNLIVGDKHSYNSHSSIAVGSEHDITAEYTAVLGGTKNAVSVKHGAILGGDNNNVKAKGAATVGGNSNTVEENADYSVIASGQSNSVESNSKYSGIFGGQANSADANYSAVFGG